jgi:AraC-like DNA-binding protein
LVRNGRFRRSADGVAAEVDPALGYLLVPGVEERFAHPAGGDVCTWLSLTPALWRAVAGDAPRRESTVYVDAGLDLLHRRMLAAAADPGYALAEQLLGTLALALRRPGPEASTKDRVAISAAREAIAADHPAAAGLLPLAQLLGISPYRLSRAFSRELGVSLTRYRNRIRVGRALDELQAGQRNLAALAASLGFADQAHLCRTIRAHLGHTPTEVRRLLSSSESERRG